MSDRQLLDDGENRAVRTFLQLYGCRDSCLVIQMRAHLARSGFDGCWPEWAAAPNSDHLTKGGAQNWLRHLFALESKPAAPSLPTGWRAVPVHATERQLTVGGQATSHADRYHRMVMAAPTLPGV